MVTHKDISVGDYVSFVLGTAPIRGIVVDDRGPIGANKVRIFTMRVPNDPYEDDVFEMPEDELAPAKRNLEPIPRAQIIEYLENGGLVQMLNANMSGGKVQPCVWLGRDSLGNVVHTFSAERGIVGGARVPFAALHNNRIFAPSSAKCWPICQHSTCLQTRPNGSPTPSARRRSALIGSGQLRTPSVCVLRARVARPQPPTVSPVKILPHKLLRWWWG